MSFHETHNYALLMALVENHAWVLRYLNGLGNHNNVDEALAV